MAATAAAIHENKRAVKDKDFGPLVKTTMTRCIHCTRCVRFIDRSRRRAGARRDSPRRNTWRSAPMSRRRWLGTVGQYHRSLPGRRADQQALCLQRALLGAAQDREHRCDRRASAPISASMRAATEVMRILPRINDDVNEEWLGDKSRFACDGLMRQRLDRPYVRKNGKLRAGDLARGFRGDRGAPQGLAGREDRAPSPAIWPMPKRWWRSRISWRRWVRPISIAGRMALSSMPAARAPICSIPTSPASRRPTRCC